MRGVRVVVILAGAWLLTRSSRGVCCGGFAAYAMRTDERATGSSSEIELEKRAATIMAVLAKLAAWRSGWWRW